ncbi:CBS domain-containing protein [Kitasatospora nipponensis]
MVDSRTAPFAAASTATVADAMDRPDPQIRDATTVDRAKSLVRANDLPYLVLRDSAGRCAGLVTRDRLLSYPARTWSGERTLVREAAGDAGPYAWRSLKLPLAAVAMEVRDLEAWPVVDDDGYLVGVLTLAGLGRHLSAG